MTILLIFLNLVASAQDQIKVIDKSRETSTEKAPYQRQPNYNPQPGSQQLTLEQQVQAQKMLQELQEYKQKIEENNKALEKLMDEQ